MGWKDIPGWWEQEEADFYADVVRRAPVSATLVEVGVAFGRSLACLARAAIDANRRDLRIFGIDPWESTDWIERDCGAILTKYGDGNFFRAFLGCMFDHAPEELAQVHIVRTHSYMASHMFLKPFFVFLDGDHDEEAVALDITAWSETGAIVLAGHDFSDAHPGVPRAVRAAFGEHGFEVRGSSWIRRNA